MKSGARITDTTILASLRDGLGNASDAQLRQVVAMVDNLAERGGVDALLAPVRPRLAQLHPERPIRFARLLFLPLEPMIVPPRGWIPGTSTIPRSALAPLAEIVRAGLDGTTQAIDAMIAKHTMSETDLVSAAGAKLWPAAAGVLAAATLPASWRDAGLPANAFRSLAEMTAFVLRAASPVDTLARGTFGHGETPVGLLEAVLDRAQADGPGAWRVVLFLLLLRLRSSETVLRAATGTARMQDPEIRVAGDQAIEAALDQLERRKPEKAESAAESAARLSSIATLLEDITASGAGPERVRRIAGIRASLDRTCQARLKNDLEAQVLAPLRARDVGPDAHHGQTGDEMAVVTLDDASVGAVEQALRALRGLATTGRRLGSAETYDRLLRDATASIRDDALGAGLTSADRARLVELLAGPDAALSVLAEAEAGAGAA